MQDHTAADTLLYFCKRLWGQPYVAPIYALLLHRWLLLRRDAGGAVQRQKHVGVLVFGERRRGLGCSGPCAAAGGAARLQQLEGQPGTGARLLLQRRAGPACAARRRLAPAPLPRAGARQLFLGDVNSNSCKFGPLFRFFAFEVAMGPNRQHLDELPARARTQLLATVASFLPYYCDPGVRRQG